MVPINDILLNNDFTGEIILGIVFFIVSILLGINEKKLDKAYQKKYILTVYLVMLLSFTIMKFNNILDSILIIILLFFITLIGGINLSYESDYLEKELGRMFLLFLKVCEWFFLTKSYLFFICSFFLIILNNLNSDKYNWVLNFLIISFFLFYHLLSNIIDVFGVYNFKKVKEELYRYIEKFDEDLRYTGNDCYNHLLNSLSFIVYMEDKDYFERKGTTFNPYYVIKRKMNNYQLNKEIVNWQDRIKSLLLKLRSIRIRYVLKNLFKRIKRFKLKTVIRKIKCYKRKIRGFSTIEQQIIRTLAMCPDSYRYKFRRKIFVEIIYNVMFFKALRRQQKRYKRLSELPEIKGIKIDLLKFYYTYILNSPKNLYELFIKISKQSRVSKDYCNYFFYNCFSYSRESVIFKKIIEEELLDDKQYSI